MKYFTANQRLLIYFENGNIIAKNLYTNGTRLICDNSDGNYCVKTFSDKVYVIFSEKNGGLYDTVAQKWRENLPDGRSSAFLREARYP